MTIDKQEYCEYLKQFKFSYYDMIDLQIEDIGIMYIENDNIYAEIQYFNQVNTICISITQWLNHKRKQKIKQLMNG